MVYVQRFLVRGFDYVLEARELINRPYGTFVCFSLNFNHCDHALNKFIIFTSLESCFPWIIPSRNVFDDLSDFEDLKLVEHDREAFDYELSMSSMKT